MDNFLLVAAIVKGYTFESLLNRSVEVEAWTGEDNLTYYGTVIEQNMVGVQVRQHNNPSANVYLPWSSIVSIRVKG